MLPVSTYEPGEMVIAAGETTGKLLFLRQGVVEVAGKEHRSPGFLNRARYSASWPFYWIGHIQPTCGPSNVRSLDVADAATLLAAIRRPRFTSQQSSPLDWTPQTSRSSRSSASSKPANLAPRSPGQVDKIADLLSSGAGNLVYAGYPYDPFTSPQ